MTVRGLSISIAAFTFALAACRTPTAAWAKGDDPTAKWMIEQEGLWAEHDCAPNEVTRFILAEDFVGTAPDSDLYTKVEAVPNGPESPTKHDCKLLSARVRWFSRDVAVIYGKETATKNSDDGTQGPQCLAWTDTWMRRNGRWQIIAVQDMVTPCP